MEESQNRKKDLIILLVIVGVVLLIIVYFFFLRKPQYDEPTNPPVKGNEIVEPSNQEDKTDEEEEGEVELTEEEKQQMELDEEAKIYQSLVSSTDKSSIYTRKKSVAKDFSDEQLLLNVIKYFRETGYGDGDFLRDPVSEVKEYVKKIYGVSVSSLPKTLTSKNSQVTADFTLDGKDYVLNPVYDEEYGVSTENDTLFVDKIEKSGKYTYVYEKLIVNASLGASGCGEIKKFDGSDKLDLNVALKNPDMCPMERDLYKLYPEYYSTFKHTFITDGKPIKYVSSELVK